MLRPGALIIDRATGQVWGDLDHCPAEDLMSSAKAIWEAGKVLGRAIWGLGKAYDNDCYIFTNKATRFALLDAPEGGRWIVIHGGRKIESYFRFVGTLQAAH